MVVGVAPFQRILRALTNHGGGRHMPAGLTEDAVVEQHAGDDSPRAAVWITSCRPSFTMSPSPWRVKISCLGPHPLGTGGHRGRTTVQGLHQIDVHHARERRVAADPDDADRVLPEAELLDGVEQHAQGDGLPAAGTQIVIFAAKQPGSLLAHLTGGLARARGRSRNELLLAVATHLGTSRPARPASMRSRIDIGVEQWARSRTRPRRMRCLRWASPARRPRIAEAHVVDHLPGVLLEHRHPRGPLGRLRPGPRDGKGQSVIGRK